MFLFKISNSKKAPTIFENNISNPDFVERFCNNLDSPSHFAVRKSMINQ